MSWGLYGYSVRESPRAKHSGLKASLQKGLEIIVPVGFDRSLIPEILKKRNAGFEQLKEKLNGRQNL